MELKWDFKGNLKSVVLDLAGNKAFYNYDSTGNRVRKTIVKGNITETRYYVGDYEYFEKTVSGTIDITRETLKIQDEKQVVAIYEIDNLKSETVRYQMTNHLGSSSLELDETAQIILFEEYHPFGTTSYRSGRSAAEVSLKRYKYCFKEHDNESGLYYYGARYYAAWIGRWTASDPKLFEYPDCSPYVYVKNRPIVAIDPDGRKIFIVISTGEYTEDENGELQQTITGSKTIDITDAKEIEKYLFTESDEKLYQLYLDSKKVPSIKQEYEIYEKSAEDDVYIFQSAIDKTFLNSNEKWQASAPAMALFNISDTDKDGIFEINDMDSKTIESLSTKNIINAYFERINGIEIQNKESRNSYISMSNSFLTSEMGEFDKNGIYLDSNFQSRIIALAHEFGCHITMARNGVKLYAQHLYWYGVDINGQMGTSESYEKDSPHDKLVQAVKATYNDK